MKKVTMAEECIWKELEVVLPHFLAAFFSRIFYSVGSKIDKITRIFDKVENIKNRGVTYWPEKNGPTVIRIIGG